MHAIILMYVIYRRQVSLLVSSQRLKYHDVIQLQWGRRRGGGGNKLMLIKKMCAGIGLHMALD